MIAHASAFSGERKEVLGLLVGCEIGSKNLKVERIIPLSEGSSSFVELQEWQFSFYEWIDLDDEKGEFIIGWYHSHPSWGVFLSSTDIETHCLAFQLRYPRAIAIVIDPLLEKEQDSKFFAIFRVLNPENWFDGEYESLEWSITEN